MVKKVKRKRKKSELSETDFMTKKDRNNIKNGLRQAFSRSEYRKGILRGAKVVRDICPMKKKSGGTHTTTRVMCEECLLLYPEKMIEVDHISEVGAFMGDWNKYIKRIWCKRSNLQLLCKWCHKVKTLEYNKEQSELAEGL